MQEGIVRSVESNAVNETSRDRQREATRQRLYAAALTIFRRDGFRDARVDDITLVAGVSRTAFYFHYPTKDDVLVEMLEKVSMAIADRVKGLPGSARLPEVLDAVAEELARTWGDERALVVDAMAMAVKLRSTSFPRVQADALIATLATRFEQYAKAGEVVVEESPEVFVLRYLYALVGALVTWASLDDGTTIASAIARTHRLFLNGVRP
jgi:AcrR family transcriptional regulator